MRAFSGPQRAAYPASLVERQVLAKGHRALICYGWWFLLHSSPHSLIGEIEQRTGDRTYTIADLVPLAGDPGGLARKLARQPRPANPWCGTRLGSLIDAGLCLGQPEELTQSWPNSAIYLDLEYWQELQRRNALSGNAVDLDSYRLEQPARYKLLRFPPSQECGKVTQTSSGLG